MGCENMDKRKKVSKRNYFRIKHPLSFIFSALFMIMEKLYFFLFQFI
ncbi:Shikimate kinase II [Methanosarcina mazei C16]|uniref:Shikimate kinase II n=1 Tax=Methanosarcina mazei C16 TaxID=1434113 RepID=A0A0E3RZH6_METMZ|nr:Shikimate kinase II [Methanosarcina mazei C16]